MIEKKEILLKIRQKLNETYKIKGPWYVQLIEELLPRIKNVGILAEELGKIKSSILAAKNETELNEIVKTLFRKNSGYYEELIKIVKSDYYDKIIDPTNDLTKLGQRLADENASLDKIYEKMDIYYSETSKGSYLGQDLGEKIKADAKENIRRYIMSGPNKRYQKVRPLYAKGMEHKIYYSPTFPNSLFKVGEQWSIDQQLNLFKSNPEIYPKVYRNGKLEASGQYYLQIEKLNTARVESEWQNIENKLQELGIIDDEGILNSRDLTDIWIKNGDDPSKMQEIYSKLKKYDSKTYLDMKKYFDLFKKCEKSIENARGMKTILDAHRYNFGYDKNGVLKCLDP